ncbi:MAG: hypothetical protein D6719_00980, partial [Candidatus Dadabacteria bacterium]
SDSPPYKSLLVLRFWFCKLITVFLISERICSRHPAFRCSATAAASKRQKAGADGGIAESRELGFASAH